LHRASAKATDELVEERRHAFDFPLFACKVHHCPRIYLRPFQKLGIFQVPGAKVLGIIRSLAAIGKGGVRQNASSNIRHFTTHTDSKGSQLILRFLGDFFYLLLQVPHLGIRFLSCVLDHPGSHIASHLLHTLLGQHLAQFGREEDLSIAHLDQRELAVVDFYLVLILEVLGHRDFLPGGWNELLSERRVSGKAHYGALESVVRGLDPETTKFLVQGTQLLRTKPR